MHDEVHALNVIFRRHGQASVDVPGLQVIDVTGNCMRDRYDWLVSFVYFVGGECAWLVGQDTSATLI